MKMTMKEFIRSNRVELEHVISSALYRHDGRGGRGTIPTPAPRYPAQEIRLWILNDEGLFQWARSCGVKI